jgi:hypothetical protein
MSLETADNGGAGLWQVKAGFRASVVKFSQRGGRQGWMLTSLIYL